MTRSRRQFIGILPVADLIDDEFWRVNDGLGPMSAVSLKEPFRQVKYHTNGTLGLQRRTQVGYSTFDARWTQNCTRSGEEMQNTHKADPSLHNINEIAPAL